MTTRLRAQQIDVGYASDAPPILRDFTVGARAGEFLGVVGPNGSGKSTLIRALSRALRPASGTVLLADNDLYGATSARQSAQSIGVVPQNTQVVFEFSVREIVGMGRAPHLSRRPFAGETPRDAALVAQAMTAAGVSAFADRLVSTMSGGEQQRVALARALAQEPSVLLLDEPTAHLDLHFQIEILALVRRLTQERALAAVAVLHDLNLAAAFCDRLVLLQAGRIVAQGSPEDVLTSAHLSAVYSAAVWVGPHPVTGKPIVLPLAEG